MRSRRRIAIVMVLLIGAGGFFVWKHPNRPDVFDAPLDPALDAIVQKFDSSKIELPAREKSKADPKLAPYEVAADLSNLENARQFRFTAEQREQLRQNHLLIYNSEVANPVLVYLQTPIPFVTSDILLHVFHTLANDSLQKAEQLVARPALESFVRHLLSASMVARGKSAGQVRKAAEANMVRFSVALQLLDGNAYVPDSVRREVSKIVASIRSARQFKFRDSTIDGALFGLRSDDTAKSAYRQIDPTPEAIAWLKTHQKPADDYFRAVIWLRQAGWDIEKQSGLLGLALAAQAYRDSSESQAAYRLFERSVDIFAEEPDGLTFPDVVTMSEETLGHGFEISNDTSPESLERFQQRLRESYSVRILDRLEGPLVGVATAPKVLFAVPGRYSLTGDLFQRILENSEMPSGDDYAAIILKSGIAPHTTSASARDLTKDVDARTEQKWFNSLTGGAQYALRSLSEPIPKAFPTFMHNDAWRMKTVNTSLGAFVQLSYLTHRYDKHAAVYLDGAGEHSQFAGYVEPVPEFYSRLVHCVEATRIRLAKIGYFERAKELYREIYGEERYSATFEPKSGHPAWPRALYATERHYTFFVDRLKMFQRLAEKELRDDAFTDEENQSFQSFGPVLRKLTFDISNVPDEREKSLICDVATNYLPPASCLQVATGKPHIMLVVVPRLGKLYLSKGSIFSYYEFERPVQDKLTEQQWRKQEKDVSKSWIARRRLLSQGVAEVH